MIKLNKKYLKSIIFLVVLLTAIISIFCAFKFIPSLTADDQELKEVTQTSEESLAPQETELIIYEAEENGQNAFELLKAITEVEYQEYDFGIFVESINGIKNSDSYFWAFYVNGQQSLVGADQTILQKSDKVEWRYEEIKY